MEAKSPIEKQARPLPAGTLRIFSLVGTPEHSYEMRVGGRMVL